MRQAALVFVASALLCAPSQGQVEIVSAHDPSVPLDSRSSSEAVKISANGRFVLLESTQGNLGVDDDNENYDLFVFDRQSASLTLVSVDQTGAGSGNSASFGGSISDDGRFVAFASYASDLVAADNALLTDVFLRDLQIGSTVEVSRNRFGNATATGDSRWPVISGDGSKVVFASDATDLVTDDNNGALDVFVWDRASGTTQLVSVEQAGSGSGNGASDAAAISDDGRWVVFRSRASDLAPLDTNGASDVFLRDLQAQTTVLVSHNAAGTASANGDSGSPVIAGDGSRIAFLSTATNLAALDTSPGQDVYAWTASSGAVALLSVNAAGTGPGAGASSAAVVSTDGRYVAFQSLANDLTAGVDNNATADVFVRDLQTGTTTLASHTSTGSSGNGYAVRPAIAGSGAFVSFESAAGNLDAAIQGPGILRFDVLTGALELVSVDAGGTISADGRSYEPAISDAGDVVAFGSGASNIVAGARGGAFVRPMPSGPTALVSRRDPGLPFLTANEMSSLRNFYLATSEASRLVSDDGRYVAFHSYATDLVPIDTNGREDIFVRDLATQATKLISVNRFGTDAGNDSSSWVELSGNGGRAVFVSKANDLVAGDGGNVDDVFVRDLASEQTTLVSADVAGYPGNGPSGTPTISRDGRLIAFQSAATSLACCWGSGFYNILVRDLEQGLTEMVSAPSASSTGGDGDSSDPSISADGGRIAFVSSASDLVPDDFNAVRDVLVRDLQTNGTLLVSVATYGGSGSSESYDAHITPNGRYVVFTSRATNLVSTPVLLTPQVYVRDLQNGTTSLASINRLATSGGAGASQYGSISDDGRYVAFTSSAEDLVASDTNGQGDLFVRDLQSGTTELVSINRFGNNGGDGFQTYGRVSGDGRWVAFESTSTNLVNGDSNGWPDVFVRDLMRDTTLLVSTRHGTTESASGSSTSPSISAYGGALAFVGRPHDLVAGDYNYSDDVYAFRLPCGSVTLNDDGWKMLGFSCSPFADRATVGDQLGDDLDPADYGSRWSVWRRDESNNAYVRLELDDAMSQSEGYWVRSLDSPREVDLLGGPTPVTTPAGSSLGESFEIPVASSPPSLLANLLGHPFRTPVPWSSVRFVDASGTEYSPSMAMGYGVAAKEMWQWNGNAYYVFDDVTPGMEGTLQPFAGFWTKSLTATGLRVPSLAPIGGGFGKAASAEHAAQHQRKGWYVRLVASAEGAVDSGNVLGQLDDAAAGADQHDLEELAPFGANYLTIVFPHPEWAPAPAIYGSDFHSLPANPGAGDEWHFEVRSSDPSRRVNLRWEGPSEILRRCQLLDASTRRPVPTSVRGEYTFDMTAPTRAFVWVLRGAAPR